MAKTAQKARGKFVDEKYYGPEPTVGAEISNAQLVNVYGWYNYFYNNEEIKTFITPYLKSIKHNKDEIRTLNSMSADKVRSVGIACRILSRSEANSDIRNKLFEKIAELVSRTPEPVLEEKVEPVETKPVVSIQDRINDKANALIADIEDMLDEFYTEGKSFDPAKFFRDRDVKPQVAQKISEYYYPLYEELMDAAAGKDAQLKEGYAHYKKAKLRVYSELIKNIVVSAEQRNVIAKAVRKPRKKKEKPASEIVKKLKFKATDDEVKVTSVKPVEIIGSNQLWVYNSKYRTLSVYNAMGPSGLSVKGSSLTGYDEKTSITKKLRKPEMLLKDLTTTGKVGLRKFMDNIKTASKLANGRINTETVLVRVIK